MFMCPRGFSFIRVGMGTTARNRSRIRAGLILSARVHTKTTSEYKKRPATSDQRPVILTPLDFSMNIYINIISIYFINYLLFYFNRM